MKALALWALVLNSVLWGSFYAICKNALETADPIHFLAVELAVAAVPATAILVALRRGFNRDVMTRGMLLGALLFLTVLTSTAALWFTTATHTALFPALNGILAAVLARTFLRKPIEPATWLAAALSGWGVSVLLVQSAAWTGSLTGDAIASLAAFLFTLYIFAVNNQTEVPVRGMWAIFAVELWTMALIGGVLLAGYSLFWDPEQAGFSAFTAEHWGAALYVGLFTTFLPTAIGLFFQRFVHPVTVAFVYVLEPVWGALAARVFLGEHLDGLGLAAAGLIVLGSFIHTAASAKAEAAKASPYLA